MPAPAISVQLYSLHAALEQDLDGTLERLSAIGFRNVEAFDFPRRAGTLRAALERNHLRSPTAHALLVESDVETPDKLLTIPTPEETFAAAAELGAELVVDPYIAPDRWRDRDGVLRLAETLNRRAAQAAEHGLMVGYHNHDHELRSQIDGRSALELFAEQLEPSVTIELDLYWAQAAGAELVPLIGALAERVRAVHVKDGPMHPGITAADMPTDQCPAGQGDVALLQALAAARHSTYSVIEFDHYAGDVFSGVAASYDYLTGVLEESA